MSKTAITVGSVIVMFAAATPALAGDFYIYGSFGRSDFGLDKNTVDGNVRNALVSHGLTDTFTSSLNNKDDGYKLQAGYQFNPYVAIEGGYVQLGRAKYSVTYQGTTSNAEIDVSGWDFSVVGILPIGSQFNLFAKVGRSTFVGKEKASVAGVSLDTGEDQTRVGGTYGVGASYSLTKETSLRIEYERFNLSGSGWTGDPKIKLITLGAAYKF